MRAHLAAIGCNGQEISRAHLAAIGCNGLSVLSTQIQCVLQDVGSHVATPRDAATKSKLGQ